METNPDLEMVVHRPSPPTQASYEQMLARSNREPRPLTPERVKALRVEHNITQAELADALYMARNTITAIETGVRPITRRTEQAILDVFAKLDDKRAALDKPVAEPPRGVFIVPKAEYSFEPKAENPAEDES